MTWTVELHPLLDNELEDFSETVQDSLFAEVELLEKFGPVLKRLHSNILNDSKHKKELQFKAINDVWRVAYAFDPEPKLFSSLLEINQGAVKTIL